MRARIHFHSDAPFFAGCENMLVSFFNDDRFMADNQVTFSYRYSAEYKEGFKQKVKRDFPVYPLALPDSGWLSLRAKRLPRFLGAVVKIAAQLLKVIYIFYNTGVLYKFFKKFKIDLLHINNGGYPGAYSCMSAVFAARLAGIRRIVYMVNNVAVPYSQPGRWLDYCFDKLVGRLVDVFVTGSVFAGQELQKVLALPLQKVENIKNGIALGPVMRSREEYRRQFGITDNGLVIGVAAVLEERKGHRYLFAALKLLKEKGAGNLPVVLLAGDGPLRDSLATTVREAGLADRVKFIGVEKNIFDFLNAIDLLVLPSVSNEDFPFSILEAMGSGKAVVASRICGIPEQIEHMQSGVLVEPADTAGLAQAVNVFWDNPGLARQFGERGRQIFQERFRSDIAVRKYQGLYQILLAGGMR